MVPENVDKRQMVFLVTLAAKTCVNLLDPNRKRLRKKTKTEDEGLRDPSTMSREEVRDAVLDAVANPAADGPAGGRPRTRELHVCKLVTVREPHILAERFHFHIGLKLSGETRFLPLKLALRKRSNLASHWSTSHTMLWSVIRYLTVPSQTKHVVDVTPLVWTHDGGALNLFEEAQEPFNARALKRRREVHWGRWASAARSEEG